MAPRVEVTVFTATYNRKETLGRLFASLVIQSYDRFEWLIVDDGSSDGTREMVEEWSRSNTKFPIVYHWKANGGKHTAHNAAIHLARGKYFAIVDSDDWYVPKALEILVRHWDGLGPKKEEFFNVEGLCVDPEGDLVGSEFPQDIFDSDLFSIQFERKKMGDTRGMCRLDILRQYPFPEDPEMRFVMEGIVWNRIANRYRTRFVNEVVGVADYQPGGLSDRSLSQKVGSARSSVLFLGEILNGNRRIPVSQWIRHTINYVRYSHHCGIGIQEQTGNTKEKWLFLLCYIFGYLRYRDDVRKIARSSRPA